MTQRDWYSPAEIRFKVREALWLIQSLPTLQLGDWPPDASNYVDILARKAGTRKAPFQTAAEYYAEITDRLEKCGLDGLILKCIECWGETEEGMSKYLQMPVWSIRKRRKTALGYVASGPARRWLDTRKRAGEDYNAFKNRKHKPSSGDTGG